MALRLHRIAVAVLCVSIAPSASAATPERLTWEELPRLVGKHVSIPLYDGGAVTGRVSEVQADALLVQVSKSTNPVTYPRGPMRVPRDKLHAGGFLLDDQGIVAGLVGVGTVDDHRLFAEFDRIQHFGLVHSHLAKLVVGHPEVE